MGGLGPEECDRMAPDGRVVDGTDGVHRHAHCWSCAGGEGGLRFLAGPSRGEGRGRAARELAPRLLDLLQDDHPLRAADIIEWAATGRASTW